MIKLRIAVVAAAAALTFGSGTAMAMHESASGDNHGAIVSSAARTTCPTGPNGVHGQCVSAIASTNGQAHRNGAGAAHVKECQDGGQVGREFGTCVSGNTHGAAPES